MHVGSVYSFLFLFIFMRRMTSEEPVARPSIKAPDGYGNLCFSQELCQKRNLPYLWRRKGPKKLSSVYSSPSDT